MKDLFKNKPNFNGNISGWDTSKVTDMIAMFYRATNFNQDLSSWNVSKVPDVSFMFLNSRLDGNEPAWYK